MFRRQDSGGRKGTTGRVSDAHYDAAPIPEFDKRPAFIHILLLNKTIRLFVVLGLASVVIPVFAYLFFFSREIGHEGERDIIGTCGHPTLYHIPCGHPSNLSQAECHLLGCCYTSLATCYHSLPSEHQYIIGSDWSSGTPAILSPYRTVTPYGRSALPEVRFDVSAAEDGVGGFRFLLSKANSTERDDDGPGSPSGKSMTLETADLMVHVYSPTFFIEVKRKADEEVIFSSARGPLVVTEEFIEWTLQLGADTLFGLGRAYLEPGTKYLLLNNLNRTAVPIVMGYNAKLKLYNGIIFNTPGLTEVEIVGSRLVVVRAQLGTNFDVQFMAGPTPAKLFQQSKAILKNRYTPPYWAYGVHVCDQSPKLNLTLVRRDLELLLNETIMFDSHCLHYDQFWISDTMTLHTELESLRQMLRDAGKKFLPTLVLSVGYGGNRAFIDARDKGILLRHPANLLAYQGRVRNRTAVYVDWRSSSGRQNLSEWLDVQWQKVINLAADGYTLDEANPRDERNSSLPALKQLIYEPDQLNGTLEELLPWNTTFSDSSRTVLSEYNLLGVAALEAIRERAGPTSLLIAGTFGINSRVAAFPANVSTSWISLRSEVDRAIGLSMVGITFTGTPICGNAPLPGVSSVPEELCIRWYQFGSLLPLFRVTADRTANRFSRFARRVMHAALRKRFALLEYLNTLILEDGAYLRPMFYHYEEAANFTTELWEQFLIGEALLVAPVLLPQMTQIAIYFPETFYELWAGQAMPGNDVLQYAVVESDLPMFLRPGYTVPLRDIVEDQVQLANGTATPITAELSRLKPLYLIGAFECNARRWKCSTEGRLLLETGFLLEFGAALDERLLISVRANVSTTEGDTLRALACSEAPTLNVTIGSVQLYGHPNHSEPLFYDIGYDFCQQEALQVEFANEHRKGPSDPSDSLS